ncbi:MAG: hypothetical protein CMB80_02740 [Flammeovirgaceae bacterium]|nr:hypothetical protein [Flammeovirgaceae bacterium]
MPKVQTAMEAGFGNQKVAADSTPFQSFNTSPDQFGATQARSQLKAGQGMIKLADNIDTISLINDKLAAAKAMTAYRTKTDGLLLEGVYQKTPDELFSKGSSPTESYNSATSIMSDAAKDDTILEMLANDRQKLFFSRGVLQYQQTEGKRSSNHIASQFRSYQGQVSAAQKKEAEEKLGNTASLIEQDYKNAERYRLMGEGQIRSFDVGGALLGTDADELRVGWGDMVASSAVRGWFAAQVDPLQASQNLASGKFGKGDEDVQKYWDQLSPKQRKVVSGDLIGRAQKLAQLRNDQRDEDNDKLQEISEKRVNDFWISDKPKDRQKRIDLYENHIKNDGYVKQAMKDAIRDNLYGGAVVQDNEEGLVVLENAIRKGTITTIAEANAFTVDGERIATAETMRMRINPLIEARQDKRFSDAYDSGLAQMGIVDVASETTSVLKKRAATFKSQILNWKQNIAGTDKDPYGNDPWKAVQAFVKEIKDDIKVDPAVMTMLKSLKARYDTALAAGNVIEATSALKSMEGLMGMLGLTMEDIK